MKKVKYQCYPITLDSGESACGYKFSAEEWFNFWVQYPAIKHNQWYNSLSNRSGNVFNRAKAAVEILRHGKSSTSADLPDFTVNTARLCPNIREFLARCLVIRAPMEMHFSKVDGALIGAHKHDVIYHMECPDTFYNISSHEPRQFRSEKSNVLQDHVNIKIPTGIDLDLPKGTQCMFLQPFFDNPNAPFKVVPGVFTEPLNHNASLIVNWMINKNEVNDFIVNKGDALMYVYIPDRVKFVKHNGKQGLIKTRFSKPKNLVTDEVKKKCPMVGK